MSEELPPREIAAIREVIKEGASGDFCDVAAAVESRFGLRVGTSAVEQVYRHMRGEEVQGEASSESGEAVLKKVLQFAKDMGGFAEARAALDAVESKLRELG